MHASRLAGPRLSEYGWRSAVPSPVNRLMAAFAADFRAGTDINLGVGYVNEDTIPSRRIAKALDAVVGDPQGYPHALNYGGAEGSPNLIGALRRFLLRNGVGGLTAEHVSGRRLVIGASGVTSLLEALATVLPVGVVVTSDPLYYIYTEYLARWGYTVLPIPEDEHGIVTDLIEARVAEVLDRVSFFYIVTVGNPSSTILSNPRRRQLVDIVARLSRRAGRQIPLIADYAYELLVHDPQVEPLLALSLFDREGLTFELGTLSKALAPALRIGYALGPTGPLLDALVQRAADVGFSAPLLNQEMVAYLLDHDLDQHTSVVKAGYRAKALAVRAWLERELGQEIEALSGGQAGFYYYLTLRQTQTDENSPFYRFTSRTTGDPAIDGPSEARHPRVVYVPGSLCVHPDGDHAVRAARQLRLSYGYASLHELELGIRLLREAVVYARGAR